MDQTAITYPQCTLNELTGEAIKAMLEDVCDNLFNPDPYLQQGGDMVRVAGLTYTCTPGAKIGRRITDLRHRGQPLDAGAAVQGRGLGVGAGAPGGRAGLGGRRDATCAIAG